MTEDVPEVGLQYISARKLITPLACSASLDAALQAARLVGEVTDLTTTALGGSFQTLTFSTKRIPWRALLDVEVTELSATQSIVAVEPLNRGDTPKKIASVVASMYLDRVRMTLTGGNLHYPSASQDASWQSLDPLDTRFVGSEPDVMQTPSLLFSPSPEGFLIFPRVQNQSAGILRLSTDGTCREILEHPLSDYAAEIHAGIIRRVSKRSPLEVNIFRVTSTSAFLMTRGGDGDRKWLIAWTLLDFARWRDRQSGACSQPGLPANKYASFIASSDGSRVAVFSTEHVMRNDRNMAFVYAAADDRSGRSLPIGSRQIVGPFRDVNANAAYFNDDRLITVVPGVLPSHSPRLLSIDDSEISLKGIQWKGPNYKATQAPPMLFRKFEKSLQVRDSGYTIISIPNVAAGQVSLIAGTMRLWDEAGDCVTGQIESYSNTTNPNLDRKLAARFTGMAIVAYSDVQAEGALHDAELRLIIIFRARSTQQERTGVLLLWDCVLSKGKLSIDEHLMAPPSLPITGDKTTQPWHVAAGPTSLGLSVLVCQGQKLWIKHVQG